MRRRCDPRLRDRAKAQTSGAPDPYAGGDPIAGETLSRGTCAHCHVVAGDQPLPAGRPKAPGFSAIANMPSTTGVSLAAFLRSPHPSMPNLILSPDELKNVVAYILSLRERR
jgi:mono/diheme cytochrome c family protein